MVVSIVRIAFVAVPVPVFVPVFVFDYSVDYFLGSVPGSVPVFVFVYVSVVVEVGGTPSGARLPALASETLLARIPRPHNGLWVINDGWMVDGWMDGLVGGRNSSEIIVRIYDAMMIIGEGVLTG